METEDCKYWLRGSCVRGNTCRFRHDPSKHDIFTEAYTGVKCVFPDEQQHLWDKLTSMLLETFDDDTLRSLINNEAAFTEKITQAKEDYDENIKYKGVLKAVESGDNKAKTKLAWYKLSGCEGCEIDVDGAVVLLKERVEDKDSDAMWMLGLCKEFGMGCEQDIEEADRLYEECKDCGNVIGEFFGKYGKDGRGTGIMNAGEGL